MGTSEDPIDMEGLAAELKGLIRTIRTATDSMAYAAPEAMSLHINRLLGAAKETEQILKDNALW